MVSVVSSLKIFAPFWRNLVLMVLTPLGNRHYDFVSVKGYTNAEGSVDRRVHRIFSEEGGKILEIWLLSAREEYTIYLRLLPPGACLPIPWNRILSYLSPYDNECERILTSREEQSSWHNLSVPFRTVLKISRPLTRNLSGGTYLKCASWPR